MPPFPNTSSWRGAILLLPSSLRVFTEFVHNDPHKLAKSMDIAFYVLLTNRLIIERVIRLSVAVKI